MTSKNTQTSNEEGSADPESTIGVRGADALLRICRTDGNGITMLTMMTSHKGSSSSSTCAVPGLQVARELHSRNKLRGIIALGSKSATLEIVEEGMPRALLIGDPAAAAALMTKKPVDACVVSADRVCANGDIVATVGTCNLAIVAAAHDVPFYVATDFVAVDAEARSGDDVDMGERPASERTTDPFHAVGNVDLWDPAFDVTPSSYITAIITEKGVLCKSMDGTLDVASFVHTHGGTVVESNGAIAAKESSPVVPEVYTELTVESLPFYLAKHAPAAMEALDASSFVDLDCEEIGDGNLNLVFIVTNTLNDKKVAVKQALPYVRSSGESWPLTLDRALYEYMALSTEKKACPDFVPAIYYFSKASALLVLEYIPPPNIILRKGLMTGIQYPTMANDMGIFCANTLFKSSGFKLSAPELRKKVEFWSSNSEMCALTEQVVFTEPYIHAANNRWTSPHLDNHKKAIEADTNLKLAAAKLKTKFITKTEALLHADLNSGSIMCSPESGQTYVIDPKFGFYGPMGFDTGAFIANLFLSYVSQEGHDNGAEYADWVLEQIVIFWKTFHSEFLKLWNDTTEHTGDKFPRKMFEDDASLNIVQEDYMSELLRDTLGFAGMKMLRRIVGSVHVEDLESIKDVDIRARCEIHGLEIAKEFIKSPEPLNSIESNSMDRVVRLARDKKPIL